MRAWAVSITELAANYWDLSPLRASILSAASDYIYAQTSTWFCKLFTSFEPLAIDRIEMIKKFIEVAVDVTLDEQRIIANIRYLAPTIQTGLLGRSVLRDGVLNVIDEDAAASPSPSPK